MQHMIACRQMIACRCLGHWVYTLRMGTLFQLFAVVWTGWQAVMHTVLEGSDVLQGVLCLSY